MGTGGGAGIDLQRKNLVAYEYLCHVVEYVLPHFPPTDR